jgi:hypothetical protein
MFAESPAMARKISSKKLIKSKKIFYSKTQYGYQKRRFYADFKSVEKVLKSPHKKLLAKT